MNRSELVTRACTRCSVPASDPLRAQVPQMVNDALHELSGWFAPGWDWLRRTVVYTVPANVGVVAFADIASVVADNTDPATAQPDNQFPVVRILECALITTGGRWPLERVPGIDQSRYYDTTVAGVPLCWDAEGQALVLAPAPAADLDLRLRVLLGERDLANDDDSALLPARYDYVLMDLMRFYIYEAKQDDERATAARKAFDASVVRAAWNSRTTSGPGRQTYESL